MTVYSCVELGSLGPVATTAELPSRRAEQLIVSPIVVGLCRADIKESAGARPVRADFGHELAAVVHDQSDPEIIPPGTLVTLDPHVRIERTTGFAEHVVARASAAFLRSAFPILPRLMSPDRAVFVEPLACAWHAVDRTVHLLASMEDRAAIETRTIGIIGAGIAGVLQAMALRYLGAAAVLMNRGYSRLAYLAERGIFGAKELVKLSESRRDEFDIVIISTSFATTDVVARAREIVRPGGLILVYAGTLPGEVDPTLRVNIDRVRRSELAIQLAHNGKAMTIAGSYGATRADFVRAIGSLGSSTRSFAVEELVSQRISLQELPDVLRSLTRMGAEQQGKTVVQIRKASGGES